MLLIASVSLLSGAMVLLIPCEDYRQRAGYFVGAVLTQWLTLYYAGLLSWMSFFVVWLVSAVGTVGFAGLLEWLGLLHWSNSTTSVTSAVEKTSNIGTKRRQGN